MVKVKSKTPRDVYFNSKEFKDAQAGLIVLNIIKWLMKKYPDARSWDDDKVQEAIDSMNLKGKEVKFSEVKEFCQFNGLGTIFDEPKNEVKDDNKISRDDNGERKIEFAKEPNPDKKDGKEDIRGEFKIPNKKGFSEIEVGMILEDYIVWLRRKNYISPADKTGITSTPDQLNEFFKQNSPNEQVTNELRNKIMEMILKDEATRNESNHSDTEGSPDTEDFSYSARAYPLDNISQSDLINGELAFRDALLGNELSEDKKNAVNALLNYVAITNPSYTYQVLNQGEILVIRAKLDNIRRGKGKTEYFSSEESSINNPFPKSPFTK